MIKTHECLRVMVVDDTPWVELTEEKFRSFFAKKASALIWESPDTLFSRHKKVIYFAKKNSISTKLEG